MIINLSERDIKALVEACNEQISELSSWIANGTSKETALLYTDTIRALEKIENKRNEQKRGVNKK